MDVWVLKENKHCSLHVFPVCHPPSCCGPEELNHHTVVTEGGLQFRSYDSTPGHILLPCSGMREQTMIYQFRDRLRAGCHSG